VGHTRRQFRPGARSPDADRSLAKRTSRRSDDQLGKGVWCTIRRCGNITEIDRYRAYDKAPPTQNKERPPMTSIEHLNPEGMARNPAFSQAVSVSGPHKVVYIGGQDGVDASGKVVGVGDLRAQTEQIFRNLDLVLAAAGASIENVVKWTIYVVQGHSFQPGFEVFQQRWGRRPNPPAITGVLVAGLARPELLVELDAVAVVPE
jgi:enamine deaminase RidA (YjgF/YER057c/UK114 family)